ncbi:MAG: hypothetical protein AB8I08_18760 [Sandaracinaceae bacterium]
MTHDGIEHARHAVHAATQIPAAAAHAWATRADDFSHTTLRYVRARGALVGAPLGPSPLRLAVRFSDVSVLLLDERDTVLSSHPFAGRTLDALRSDVAQALSRRGLEGEVPWLEHDLPAHPLYEGAAFGEPLREGNDALEAWFQRADEALARVRDAHPTASPVRCWPHHFDTASLIALDVVGGDRSGSEDARSVGVGMSPGDAHLAAPYWYVSPWPAPESAPPALERGRWHRDGFTAAVLDSRGPEVDAFLTEAIAASLALLS